MRRSVLSFVIVCCAATACAKVPAQAPGVQLAAVTDVSTPATDVGADTASAEVSADAPLAEDVSADATPADVSTIDAPPAQAGQGCKAWAEPVASGTLDDEELSEISGLVASHQHQGVFWMHNDSGNKPRLYAVDQTGKRVATYKFKDVPEVDWEDIALAPCSAEPGLASACLYVADTGDNEYKRSVYHVLRWAEPGKLPAPGTDDSKSVDPDKVEAFAFTYPDGPHNVEAMVVLPDTRVVLLTKQDDGLSKLYRVALQSGKVSQAELLGVLEVRDPPLVDGLSLRVTAADLGEDGRSLLVRTYFRIFLFDLGKALTGPATEAAPVLLAAKPTLLQGAFEPQGEAIAWDTKTGFWQVAEGVGATLFYVGCAPAR